MSFYNWERPHQSLGYKTPAEVYLADKGGENSRYILNMTNYCPTDGVHPRMTMSKSKVSRNQKQLFKTKIVPGKPGSGELFGEEFVVDEEPVECLGMAFENDEKRREYFLEKLREKLKDPEFRKIEGFPIGQDEDILALSDPPYYTACIRSLRISSSTMGSRMTRRRTITSGNHSRRIRGQGKHIQYTQFTLTIPEFPIWLHYHGNSVYHFPAPADQPCSALENGGEAE